MNRRGASPVQIHAMFAPRVPLSVRLRRLGPLLLLAAGGWAAFPAPAAESTAGAFSAAVLRGFELERAGQYAAAAEAYTEALKHNEESPTAYVRRAFVSAKAGQLERAAMDLREASLLQPVSMTDYTTMAWLLATHPVKSVRDGTRAVGYAQKAAREAESAETLDILAAAYAEMGNFSQSRNIILAAVKKYPDSPRIPAMRERLELYNQKKPFRDVWLADDEVKKLENRILYPR